MTHSALTESYEFLMTFLTGGGVAAMYFGLSFLRKKGVLFTVLGDLIFAVSALVLLFFTLQKACLGNVRVYQLAGFIIGILFFNLLLRRISAFFTALRKVHARDPAPKDR